MSIPRPFFLILFALASLVVSALLLSPDAAAHVRWFTDADDPLLATFPVYSLFDVEVLIWIGIGLFLIACAIALDGRLPVPPIVNSKIRHDFMELLRIFTGISLVLTAYSGGLIAPHLVATGGFGLALLFLQGFIGILLIANRFVHHAALLLGLLFLGAMIQSGFVRTFEYVNMIGIALFLFFNHAPSAALQARLKPYSVAALRIFTGLALVVLGLSEKIFGAALGQAYLAIYEWNFMQTLGFDWYSDQLFVLSAGAMEVTFGIILMLGVVTRLNTLVIAGFMLTSNVVFLLTAENQNALIELIGHMPIIATALILLLLGYGQRLKVPNPTLKWVPFRLPGAPNPKNPAVA